MRGDAGHRKGRATRSESSEKTQVLSPLGRVGGVSKPWRCPASPAPCFLPDATQGRSLWFIIIKIWYNLGHSQECLLLGPMRTCWPTPRNVSVKPVRDI